MSDFDSINQRIIANPNSDQPRYDLADWYAVQSVSDTSPEERAKFIRNQLQYFIESQSPQRKVSLSLLSYKCDVAQETFQKNWLKDILPFVKSAQFHRGCVEYISCTLEQFEHAKSLFSQAPIRHLDLIFSPGEDLNSLDLPHLEHIQTLSINNASLGEQDLKFLANLSYAKNICWLDLANNHIDEAAVEELILSTSLPLLQYVNLAGNPCDPTESFADEFGAITDTWLPEVGERLEQQFGRVEWLHRSGNDISEWHQDRFVSVLQAKGSLAALPLP